MSTGLEDNDYVLMENAGWFEFIRNGSISVRLSSLNDSDFEIRVFERGFEDGDPIASMALQFPTFDFLELIRDDVKIEWENTGEGMCGEYNPDDPDDVALYRFYVSKRDEMGEWQEVADASYCTQVPVDTPDHILRRLLYVLMDVFYTPVMEGNSVKKLGEEMSWISPSWLKE